MPVPIGYRRHSGVLGKLSSACTARISRYRNTNNKGLIKCQPVQHYFLCWSSFIFLRIQVSFGFYFISTLHTFLFFFNNALTFGDLFICYSVIKLWSLWKFKIKIKQTDYDIWSSCLYKVCLLDHRQSCKNQGRKLRTMFSLSYTVKVTELYWTSWCIQCSLESHVSFEYQYWIVITSTRSGNTRLSNIGSFTLNSTRLGLHPISEQHSVFNNRRKWNKHFIWRWEMHLAQNYSSRE